MKSLLRRIIGKIHGPESDKQDADQADPQRNVELENLEPRMLFSAAPVEAPDEGNSEPEAAEESVVIVSREAANQAAKTLEGVEMEEDDPDGLLTAEHTIEQAQADTALTATQAELGANGPTDVSGDQNVTLVNVDGVSAGLNQATLDAVAEAAKQRWIDSGGLSGDQIAALDNVTYQIDHLDAARLGSVNGNTISVDGDAWGKGWFIDATPLDDGEFGSTLESGALSAAGGLGGQYDLLTVLIHEQGHILGLTDIFASGSSSGDVMSKAIGSETRLLPAASQADGAIPGSHEGDGFLNMTFDVTNLLDTGAGSLRQAVSDANGLAGADFIRFTGGGIGTISLSSGQLTITDDVTINSTSAAVVINNTAGNSRVFEVQGDAVTFQDLTISGGFLTSTHGAGLYNNNGQVTLTNVVIDNNQTSGSGADRHGGGVWNNGANATLTGTNVDFTNNKAARTAGGNAVGGGLWSTNGSTTNLTDVTFSKNEAREGGGFYVSGGFGDTVTLTNATIDSNKTLVRGAGFRNSAVDTVVTINGGTVSNNTADQEHGGGFYNNGKVVLTNVDITGNKIFDTNNTNGRPDDSHGAGFYNSVASPELPNAGIVEITGGSITGNTAYGHGGGFWNRGGIVTIDGTSGDPVEIQSNRAGLDVAGTSDSRHGGGFWNTDAGQVTVNWADFDDGTGTKVNKVYSIGGTDADNDLRGVGGGFYNTSQGKVALNNVDISKHRASSGAAFYQDGIQSQVIGTNVTLDNNTARVNGGGFRNASTGGIVTLTDSSIDGNVARFENGGGFYNAGTVTLDNTDVSNGLALDLDNANRRDSHGGGFYNGGGIVNLINGSDVLNNVSYGDGAGFRNASGIVNMTDGIVDGNSIVMFSTSTQHGGGFWNSGDAVTNLENVIISNNETGRDTPLGDTGTPGESAGTRTRGVGGGFWNTDGSTVNISGDSQIIGNRSEGGGGFYNTSTASVVNITGTMANPIEIDGNSSRGVGGGFQNTGGTITNLDWVEITNNTTDGGRGGGFYNDGGQVIGTNLKINDNKTGFLGRSGDEQGGGFWNSGNGLTDLTDSEVNNNFSYVHGGAGYNEGGTINLTRVTAEGNFANNSGGGFFINNSSVLNLTDSSVSDNIARDHGGGFWTEDDSKVTALRTNIDGNLAGYDQDGVTRRESGTAGIGSTPTGSDLRGGGFWASGRSIVTLTDSTVNDNEAARHGGGGNLENETQLFLNGTTVANNVANNHGGGFRIASNAHLDATNSTISGNYAGFGRANNGGTATADYDGRVGGGIWSQSGGNRTILNHVTISDNKVTAGGSGGGGGIYRSSGFIQAENSILFGNIADAEQAPAGQDASDVRGAITLVGANVFGAHSTSGGGISGEVGNRITADPNLAPLADNGNPVTLPDGGTPQTHAITNTSVASGSAVNSRVAIDQLGNGRPGTSTATSPTNINTTGAALLTNPDFTELDRNGTISGSSIVYGAGTVDNEDLFDYVVLPEVGEFPLTGPITVSIDFTFTKVTADQDYVFYLSNGVQTLTWTMIDNNGGDIAFGGSTIISDGEPALGVSTTATFEFVLDQNGSTLNATRNGFSGSNSVSTVLGPMNGLTFSARLGNAGEQSQVDNIAVTYTGLTGQTGGADLGAYEVDPVVETLTIDDLTIPENAVSGTAFDVAAVSTSTGAGPVNTNWVVTDSSGATVASGTGDMTSFTVTNPTSDPVRTLDVTVTVDDGTTSQVVSETSQITVVDTTAMPATFAAGSIVVDKIGDVVDGNVLPGEVTLREAINAANASGAGSYGITFAASINTMPILASDQAKLNYDGQTVDFAVGEIVTGSNGAFGTVVSDTDNGVNGQLVLSGVTGTFANNNALTSTSGGAALVNGTMFNNDNFGYDFDILKTNGAVFIVGNGTANTIVSGNNLDTVFEVRPNVTAYFKDLTITGGQTAFTSGNDEHGGGVRNQGSISVFQGTDITGNAAAVNTGAVGGGIYTTSSGLNPGRVYMTGGSVANNTSQSSGGGIYLSGNNVGESILHLDGTVIDGNTASFGNTELDSRRGGGVYFTDDGNRLVFNDVTVSDNATDGRNASDGGGLAFAGADHTIEITGGSIIRNQAGDNLSGTGTSDSDGGGFWSATTRSTFDFTGVDVGGELTGGADVNGLGSAIGDGNLAEDEGGGFYLEGRFNTYNLIDTRIIGNVGQDDGGGFMIINDSETVNISQTGTDLGVIRNNLSTTSNGAGFRNDGIVNITGTAAIPFEIRYNEARGSVGGGFYTTSNGTTTLTDVVVRNNQALNNGGGYYNSGGGHVIITSSTASTSGTPGSFVSKIIDNKVTNGTAGDGGGFYQTTSYSTSDLKDVLISGNTSVDEGGGFYLSSNFGKVNLTNVDITNNTAADNGGGFYNASNGSIVELDTVLIDKNTTLTEQGGGFRNNGFLDGKKVTITNNTAVNGASNITGGGFYNGSGLITLVDATIDNNEAGGRGGGFFNTGGGIVDISSSDPNTFRSSISDNKVSISSNDGGGFWNDAAGSTVRLNGVDMKNNIAGDDGGGFWTASDNSRVELTDTILDGNTSQDDGGGFSNASAFSVVTLDDVQIINNVSNTQHGGGFRNVGQVTGQDVVIDNNIAGQADQIANNDNNRIGGAFYSSGTSAIVDLTRVEITNNDSHGRGGGFYNANGQVNLTDFAVSGNTNDTGTSESLGRGGGFWNSSSGDITLNRGEISENESFSGGAGFYQQDNGSTVNATNVTISGNRAGIDQTGGFSNGRVGGGFWGVSGGSEINLNHVTISDNGITAGAGSGAGFRAESGVRVNLENSIVFGNKSEIDTGTTGVSGIDNNAGTLLVSTGANIVDQISGTNPGGFITTDPGLFALTDLGGAILPSGGSARVHAIQVGGSASDTAVSSTLTEDQRGITRPEGAANDIGAYEGPGTVYVNDQFAGSFGDEITDGDLELAGDQTSHFGISAFSSIADVLTTYASFGGNIVVNGGTYASANLTGGTLGDINLQLVQDLTNGENDVTISGLDGDSGDSIETRFHGAAEAHLVVAGTGLFAGDISGAGGLDKSGTGPLILSGTNTYAGATNITGANPATDGLILNGTHTGGGTYTVGVLAALAGTGSTDADVNVTSGLLGPADEFLAPATLGVGNTALDSTSFFVANIGGNTPGDGAGNYSQLLVAGTVNLGGSTLDLSLGTHVPVVGESYTIIDNDGADNVTGTFNGLAEGAECLGRLDHAGGNGNEVALSAINGTGANDILTLDMLAGGDLQYTLNSNPLVTLTAPANFVFNGGDGDDLMIVNTNDLSLPAGGIDFNGGPQTYPGAGHDPPTPNNGDALQVNGLNNIEDVLYTPDAGITGDGTIDITGGGSGTITFTGLEPVDISGMATATLSLPGADDVIDLANGFDAATGLVPAIVASGVSGGVAIESAHFFNNTTVEIDTTGTAGNDTITITDANNAHLNGNLIIDTGTEAADTVTVNGAATFDDDITITTTTTAINGAMTSTNNGEIEFETDNIAIAAAVNAGTGRVEIEPLTAGALIHFGNTELVGELNLSDTEVDFITAGVLEIGDATSGRIQFSGTTNGGLISPDNVSTVHLITGSFVTDGANDNTGGGIRVSNLAIEAGGANAADDRAIRINNTNGGVESRVDTFAASSSDGWIEFREDNNTGTPTPAVGLTIGTVDGVVGVVNTSNTTDNNRERISITAVQGDLVIANDMSSRRDIFVRAAGNDNQLILNSGVTVGHVEGGTLTLRGDNIDLEGTVNSPGRNVSLQQDDNGNEIQIGTGAVDVLNDAILEIDQTELDRITAGTVIIGRTDFTAPIDATGNIVVVGTTTLANSNNLGFRAHGTVSQNAGATITETNLGIISRGDVTLDEANDIIGNVAMDVRVIGGASGNVIFRNNPSDDAWVMNSAAGVDNVFRTDNGDILVNTTGTINLDDDSDGGTGPGQGSGVQDPTVELTATTMGVGSGDITINIGAGTTNGRDFTTNNATDNGTTSNLDRVDIITDGDLNINLLGTSTTNTSGSRITFSDSTNVVVGGAINLSVDGTGDADSRIEFHGGTTIDAGGDINLEVKADNGSFRTNFDDGNPVTITSTSGTLTINADRWLVNSNTVINIAGQDMFVSPFAVGDNIILGDATNGANGNLRISNPELNTVTGAGGELTIGDADTGDITVGGAIQLPVDTVFGNAGSAININSAIDNGPLGAPAPGTSTLTINNTDGTTTINADIGATDALESLTTDATGTTILADGVTITTTGDVTFNDTVQPGTSPGQATINANGLVFNTTTIFDVELQNTTPGTGHDQLVVNGTVTLNNADLDLTPLAGLAPSAGDEFVLISNDGTDAVNGTFFGLAEGNILSLNLGGVASALFQISYQGGTLNNDVVLTALGVSASTDILIDTSGNLIINDIDETIPGGGATGNSDDTLTVRVEGTEVVVTDPNNALGTLINGAVQQSLGEVRVDVSLFTGDVIVNGLSGNDDIRIGDLGASTLPLGLTVNGGDGFDNILYTGTGSVLAGAGAAEFNAEEIEFYKSDLTTADGDITANGTGGTTSNHQGVHLLDSDLTTGTGGITLNGSGGDTGNSNQGVLLSNDSNLTTTGGNIDIDGAGGSGIAGKGVLIFTGSDLSAGGAGTLTIDGTGGTGNYQNEGVFFNSDTSATVASGNMTITGTGGGSAGGGLGVSITDTALSSTAGGSITIAGTSAAMGGFNNGGVQLADVTVTTTGATPAGSVTIRGSGAAAGTVNNVGVKLSQSDVTTGTDASINIDGTGTGNGSGNSGVILHADTNLTVTGSGAIDIDGTGSTAGTLNNDGVELAPGTDLTVADGSLTITGTGNGTGISQGVDASGATLTGTGSGAISITGTSGATGSGNQGIFMTNSTVTTAVAGSGSITLDGSGSASGLTLNEGVKLTNTDLATGADGAIEIDGTGGGGGTGLGMHNTGVALLSGSTVAAAGSGTVDIDGTGGSGSSLNRGVYITGPSASVSSVDGNLTIDGTANGTVSLNRGIEAFAATIETTGTGNLTMNGTGSTMPTTLGVFNTGVYLLNSTAQTSTGTLTIEGNGGTGLIFNEGVRIQNSTVNGAGTTNVTGIANGATSMTWNSGVYIFLNSTLGSNGTITGTGGGGTYFNHGIYIHPTTTNSLALAGTAGAGQFSLPVAP